MSEAGGYKIRNQNAVHFITFAVVEWIDIFKRIDQQLEYHNNPVEAGIVERAEDFLYSSARDYAEIKGLLEIEFLD